jgi:tetratricopeptide (TPR) repeat protein
VLFRLAITRSLAIQLALGTVGYVETAHAQTTEAVAEALFRDGKLYFQAQDYDRGCPKLAQSYKIDPAGGTVLLLAICYEQQGRLASAWARYNDALALAKRDNREDRERRAREGLASVEPRLSYIKLLLDPTCNALAGLSLSIDGTELPALSDTRLPVDPGKHQLVIKAPDYEDWAMEVTVGGPADLKEVPVPALRKRAELPAAVSPPAALGAPAGQVVAEPSAFKESRTSHAAARRTAYILGGVGLAGVAVGSYFGVRAIRLNKQANDVCPTSECREDQLGAISTIEDARSNARLANILIGAGSAAVISAAVLWYVYRHDTPALSARVDAATRSVSIAWQHSF